MDIEFVDIVLLVVYITMAVALGSVLWSIYRRNRKGAGRQSVQNGIHIRRLLLEVWGVVVLAVVLAWAIGDGTVADTMVITSEVMLSLTVIAALWALIRRK